MRDLRKEIPCLEQLGSLGKTFSESCLEAGGALAGDKGSHPSKIVPSLEEAIRRCGRTGRVHVLSHDSGPEIRRFLKEGLVDFTIDQNLVYQSYQSLDLLFRAVAERKQPEREFFYPASPILNAETL